jgi:HNH endonuclease
LGADIVLIADLAPELRELLLGMGFVATKAVGSLNGYPVITVKRAPMYVHRLVAAHYIGVKLTRSTFVHHKDQDRSNFRLGNLQVCTHGEHNGMHRQCGADNHFFGRSHSARVKARLKSLGKRRGAPVLDDAAKAKISAAAKRRRRSDEGRFEPC